MDFTFTKEQSAIVDSVRAFREEELMPMEQEFLQNGTLAPKVRTALEQKARARGLWALEVPTQYGGRGFDETTMCLISEEIYKHPAMFKFGGSPEPCLYTGTERQRADYLLPVIAGERASCYAFTEPGAGSDFAGITTRAERVAGGFLINGEKSLIAYLDRADFIIVFASTDPARGAKGVSCFLVDRDHPGVTVSPPRRSMGDSWETNEIRFADCLVPECNMLGELHGAWRMANELLTHGRLRIAAYLLGIAQRCLELATAYAQQRSTWGKPLAARQAIQWMIADSHVELEAARLLVYRAAWVKDQGTQSRVQDFVAKLYASEMAQRVTDRCLQIFGGAGYLLSSPVQSFYRQVRVWRIGHGSSEISRWIIARDLLGDAARS
jgi:acyl-CoA dehydrogenase